MAMLKEGKIDNQKIYESLPFPKTFIPGDDCSTLACLLRHIQENKADLENKLHEHGALLFRGFPVCNAEAFNEFVSAFGWKDHPYQGIATRTHVVGSVMTANEGPLETEIFFHHELSRHKEVPTKIFFMCETAPPEGGGQTAILQSHRVTDHMESVFPEFIKDMRDKGLMQIQCLDNSKSTGHYAHHKWQSYFRTQDPHEAERRAAIEGWRLEWIGEDGAQVVKGPMEGIKVFEGYEGRKMWFNYIPFGMSKEVTSSSKLTLGDGNKIPDMVVEESKTYMNDECVDIAWEKGDVLVLDNLAVMHARRPSLPPRRILVALCK